MQNRRLQQGCKEGMMAEGMKKEEVKGIAKFWHRLLFTCERIDIVLRQFKFIDVTKESDGIGKAQYQVRLNHRLYAKSIDVNGKSGFGGLSGSRIPTKVHNLKCPGK